MMKLMNNKTNGQTHNGRFGASGAVRCWKIGTLFAIVFVVGKIVEAATSPSRWDVIGNLVDIVFENKP